MERALSRKEFLTATAAVGAAFAVEACGNDDIGGGSGAAGSTGSDGWGSTTGNPSGGNTTGGNTSTSGNGGAPSTSSTTGNGGDSPNATTGAGGDPASTSASTGGASACERAPTHEITCNHDHTILELENGTILNDIAAGSQKEYTLTTGLNHTHKMTLTAADFLTLQQGGTVFKFVNSVQDHCVVISCAAPGNPAGSACDMGDAIDCDA